MSERNEKKGIIIGIFLLLGMHIPGFFLVFMLSILLGQLIPDPIGKFVNNYGFFYVLFSPGLYQLLYGIPLVLWVKQRENFGVMKGVIIGGVITALLNGGCWLFMVSGG